METEKPSFFERLNNWAKRSITLKLFSIGILILILLIPSSMLTSLIRERESLRDKAVVEVSSKWGSSQTIGGPVISIPYKVTSKNKDGNEVIKTEYAHFLPESLDITGNITPEKRYRGIYVVALYNSQLHIKGKFPVPDLNSLGIAKENLLLNEAFISIGITDMKGIKENINVKLNDTIISMNPGIVTSDIFNSGVSHDIPFQQSKEISFDFNLNLNGSSTIYFLPFGKETKVNISSTWSNPSFEGSFLPDNREISNSGFKAQWKVLHLNRNYPQQGRGSFVKSPDRSNDDNNESDEVRTNDNSYGNAAGFGIKFMLPVDEYSKTMRSTKYNTMFIILTFVTFFFIEVLNKKRLHPIQYLLVGFAICLFYVMLLSFSEYIKFDFAYLGGCVITLLLISFYARNILKSNYLTGMITGILIILYGFFYSLLQLQDYALLLGSLGLLLILAIIMYLTRNIDWYMINTDDK